MLCLFSDGSVLSRAGGVSLSLGDKCWQLSEFVVNAVLHKDGMILVLSSASNVQKQKLLLKILLWKAWVSSHMKVRWNLFKMMPIKMFS